ncbi:MAG: hypothetical protein WAU58_16605 [Terriglobales bacterium]
MANRADPRSLARRRRRKARTTLAACLLGVAVVSLLGFIVHISTTLAPSNPPNHGNDSFESILGLVWFTSALLAMIVSTSLHSPARQLILCGGGMLTVLSVFFWVGVVASV